MFGPPSSPPLQGHWRIVLVAATLFAGNSFCAEQSTPPKKPPTEVKIVSVPAVPPAQPTEVKIVSLPVGSEGLVKIVPPQPDESARKLVTVTWYLVIANAILCLATFGGSWWQSRDTKRRDRAAMLREVSRAAHKLMTEASRADQMAALVPPARTQLYLLLPQGNMPSEIRERTLADLGARHKALNEMIGEASFVVADQPPLSAMKDKELTRRLWNLDRLQVQLDTIRDAITTELEWYETESATLRQQRTALQAAQIAAPRPPLKTKLGE